VYAFLLWLQYDNEIYIKFVIYISKFILGHKKALSKRWKGKIFGVILWVVELTNQVWDVL